MFVEGNGSLLLLLFLQRHRTKCGPCRVEDLGDGRKKGGGAIGVKEQISSSLGNIYSLAVRAWLRKE